MKRLFELVKQLALSETRTEIINGEEVRSASDHYVEIASLSQMLEEMYAQERETGQPVTDAATLDVLRQSFARVLSICDEYNSLHPGNELMSEITGLLKDGSEALYNYNPGLGYTLEDVFDPEKRLQRTKAQNLNTAKIVGTELSARIPAELDGRKGYFTVENQPDQISRYLHDYVPEDDDYPADLKDLLSALDTGQGREAFAEAVGTSTLGDTVFKYVSYRQKNATKQKLLTDAETAVKDFFKKAGVSENIANNAMQQENFLRAFSDFLTDAVENIKGPALNKTLGDMHTGANIEKRNVAVSRTADMLGMSNIIAYATTSTAEINGKTVNGVFMEDANAVDTNKFKNRISKNGMQNEIDFNEAEVIRQASDIQALDYICGGTDRHDLNIMVRYDEAGKKINGIVGIDNDMSFGNMDPEGIDLGRRYMAGPDNMLVMRRSTADRIMSMQKNSFAESMKGLIKEDEMEAAWKRVERLQSKIAVNILREGDLTDKSAKSRLGDDISGGHIRILSDNDPLWEKMSIKKLAVQAGNRSLFGQIAKSEIFKMNPLTNEMLDCRCKADEIRIGIKTKYEGSDIYKPEDIMQLYRHRKNGLNKNDISAGLRYYWQELEPLMNRDVFDNKIYTKMGIKDIPDCIYCDGKPIRDVLKDKYGITPSDNDELKADIAMLATSGRHQLSIANIQKDKGGKLFVNVSDITTDLKPLDKYKGFFGTARSTRAEKMARNAEKTRKDRFAAISALVEKAYLEKTGQPLNPAENTVKQAPGRARSKSVYVKHTSLDTLLVKEGKNPKQNNPVNTEIKHNRSNSLSKGRKIHLS